MLLATLSFADAAAYTRFHVFFSFHARRRCHAGALNLILPIMPPRWRFTPYFLHTALDSPLFRQTLSPYSQMPLLRYFHMPRYACSADVAFYFLLRFIIYAMALRMRHASE